MAREKTIDSPLTRTQMLALKFVDEFTKKYVIPPTLNEVAQATGLGSKTAARYTMRVLVRRCAIEYVPIPGRERRPIIPVRVTAHGRATLDEFERLNPPESPALGADNTVVIPEFSVRRNYISYGEDVIIKNPDVCNGAARINGTEIPVWLVVKIANKCMAQTRGGYDNVYECLAEYFPSVSEDALSDAVDYSIANQEEIAEDTIKNDVKVSMV